VSLAVDIMHLVVIATGVGIAAWALVALHHRLRRGRYLVFSTAAAGAIFGCAALAGEIGVLSPFAWFVIVMAAMLGAVAIAYRWGEPRSQPA
jgi:hypothetical protein